MESWNQRNSRDPVLPLLTLSQHLRFSLQVCTTPLSANWLFQLIHSLWLYTSSDQVSREFCSLSLRNPGWRRFLIRVLLWSLWQRKGDMKNCAGTLKISAQKCCQKYYCCSHFTFHISWQQPAPKWARKNNHTNTQEENWNICEQSCVSSSMCCVLTYISHAVAAASAKSLQSCPTLCDPKDSNPPGSPIPGILQARTLEWVAIAFSEISHKWRLNWKLWFCISVNLFLN